MRQAIRLRSYESWVSFSNDRELTKWTNLWLVPTSRAFVDAIVGGGFLQKDVYLGSLDMVCMTSLSLRPVSLGPNTSGSWNVVHEASAYNNATSRGGLLLGFGRRVVALHIRRLPHRHVLYLERSFHRTLPLLCLRLPSIVSQSPLPPSSPFFICAVCF